MVPAVERVGVLVVDDRPDNILALQAILEGIDCEVVTANSGINALRHVLKRDFAVILLDVFMPTMDGFETANLIAQRAASQRTPIIFLTAAGTDVSSIFKGYLAGAVDYLIKPLDAAIVRAKVSVFIDLFRKTQLIKQQEAELREGERRSNERALRDREAEYESTFEHAAAGIAHLGTDGRWLRVNRKLCEILGYSRKELLRMQLQDVAHPEEVTEQVASLRRLLRAEEDSYRKESRYLHHDAHVVWFDTTLSLLRDESGKPKKFVAVMEDVTGRRLEEEGQRVLAEASEILLSSFDHRETLARMGECVVPKLADFCVVDLAAEQAGFPTELVIAHASSERAQALQETYEGHTSDGGWAHSLVTASKAAVVFAEPSKALFERLTLFPKAASFLRTQEVKSLLVVPLTVRGMLIGSMTFISSTPGRRYDPQYLEIAQDLARRAVLSIENARLYREAQEAVRVRDEFLSIASHELRTPITPLQIQLQRLLGVRGKPGFEAMSPEQLRTLLERALGQVGRIATLVGNLLDVTRIHAGHLTLDLESVDLSILAREVVARFKESAPARTIRVHADKAVLAFCDRSRMEQVISNLISNALKYGLEKPIDIFVEKRSSRGVVRVQDQGMGIAGDKLPLIFERFERGDAARAYAGLGLGLYITQQIVQAHGGTIDAQSQVRAGSTFTVDIPLRASSTQLKTLDDTSDANTDVRERPSKREPGVARNVLLVEDDEEIGESMRDLLQHHGHRVVLAKNGQQALDILATQPCPDVILLDLMMPIMDGYAFRAEQKKTPTFAAIPVVLVSGDDNLEGRAREMDAAGFLRKPPTAQELLGVVEAVL